MLHIEMLRYIFNELCCEYGYIGFLKDGPATKAKNIWINVLMFREYRQGNNTADYNDRHRPRLSVLYYIK